MSAVTASQLWTLMCFSIFLVVSADQKNITAESGQDVTLTCRAPNNSIRVVEWSRADLGDEYVLLYRDRHFHSDNQHPSFKNRVDLQDRQRKDGDVSLILNNVTINDAGTYKCRVLMEETQSSELISIYLRVDPPGKQRGHTEDGGNEDGCVALIAGVCIPAVLLVAVVGFLIYRKHEQQQSQNSYQPPVELQPV